jgi:carbon-monoxide dehydrogenase medium subunit
MHGLHEDGPASAAHGPAQQPLVGHRSRKQISEFRLHRPATLAEAWELWSQGGPFCDLMAGGVDLINDMKSGRRVDQLIAIGHLDELRRLHVSADVIALGAAVSHDALGKAALPGPFDALSGLWRGIANPRVRFKGTLGGNILAGNPHYDAMPCLEALGAWTTGRLKGGAQVRLSPSAAACSGGELLLSEIVIPRTATAFAYERSERPIASVALALFEPRDRARSARVAVGCAFARPAVVDLELPGSLATIGNADASSALIERVMGQLPAARSDLNASARYRSHLIAILLKRVIAKIVRQIDGQ